MKKVLMLIVGLAACASSFAQSGKTVKLTGQVVCSVCWFESNDRKKHPYGTPADVSCAGDCSEKGLPQALAVEGAKGFSLYTLERGAFHLSGKDFLEFVPKTVEVEGEVRKEKDKRFIKVNALKVIETAPAKPVPVSDDAVLALKDMAGVDQSLASLRGRVVVVNFWATWCEPCRDEMPSLERLQSRLAGKPFEVLAVNYGEGVPRISDFLRKENLSLTVLLDPRKEAAGAWKAGGLPMTFLVDARGRLRYSSFGERDWSQGEALRLVQTLLAEAPGAR